MRQQSCSHGHSHGSTVASGTSHWGKGVSHFYRCGCCCCTLTDRKPKKSGHQQHLSLLTSSPNPSNWTSDGNFLPTLAVTPFCTAIMGRSTTEGPHRQHSGPFGGLLPAGYQQCCCFCLSALAKGKNVFPHNMAVGIKAHSEWPRVARQMLARIALVAVPTGSARLTGGKLMYTYGRGGEGVVATVTH